MSQIRERNQDAEDLQSLNDDFPELYDDFDDEDVEPAPNKVGRPRIPERWTR